MSDGQDGNNKAAHFPFGQVIMPGEAKPTRWAQVTTDQRLALSVIGKVILLARL